VRLGVIRLLRQVRAVSFSRFYEPALPLKLRATIERGFRRLRLGGLLWVRP
jgi:hypothetical protein